MRHIALARFWQKVDASTDACWVWTGALSNGYGRFKVDGRVEQAHRWLMVELNGPIAPDLEVDHLCRNRACVRPGHLEVVTKAENARRAPYMIDRSAAPRCRRGHDDWRQRPDGRRCCRTCESFKKSTRAAVA